MRIIRLGLVNLGVLVLLVLGLNVISAALIDGERWLLEPLRQGGVLAVRPDPRSASPLYPDQAFAQRHFRELFAMGFRYAPFVGWSRNAFAGETITINAAGDREHPATTETPRLTIRFFGGSALWGTGAEDGATIPALFNAAAPDHRVLNHGESGFTSRQNLARLVNLANQGAALDLVVFYDGANDADILCRADVSLNGHARETKIGRALELPGATSDNAIVARLEGAHLGRIFVASAARMALAVQGALADEPSTPELRALSRCRGEDDYAERVAATLLGNWGLARTIVESRGGRFLAVLQPVAQVGKPRLDHLDEALSKRHAPDDYRRVYRALAARLEGGDLPWVLDLSAAFDGDERFYIDQFHVTERGNRVVAARIKARLEELYEL